MLKSVSRRVLEGCVRGAVLRTRRAREELCCERKRLLTFQKEIVGVTIAKCIARAESGKRNPCALFPCLCCLARQLLYRCFCTERITAFGERDVGRICWGTVSERPRRWRDGSLVVVLAFLALFSICFFLFCSASSITGALRCDAWCGRRLRLPPAH